MLTEKDIQRALHADRVVTLPVPNPHGPLGLEQLASAVARITGAPGQQSQQPLVRRAISLSVEVWNKLDQLAQTTTRRSARAVTASEIATAIIEQFMATTPTASDD